MGAEPHRFPFRPGPRLRLLLLALLALPALPLSGAGGGGAAGPPLGALSSRIAFVSEREQDRAEIFVMGPDGSGQANLTRNAALDFVPAWSPDASRLTFDSSAGDENWDVFVMEASGHGVVRLTTHPAIDRKSSWSPDGQRLAFESDRDGNWNIYTMASDGSGQTGLTTSPATDQQPAWSPDGSRIVFASDRGGNDMDIYVMQADGTGVTQLTSASQGDWTPAWSPDGSRIAFTSYRTGGGDIYTMNPDGSGVAQLTSNPELDHWPSWSPDGTAIVFESKRDGNSEIYVMSADGSGQTRLTVGGAQDLHPTWSPFLQPGLAEIAPAEAVANAGNVPVVIRGRNLAAPLTVRVGAVNLPADKVTLVSENEIQATVPVDLLGPGTYDVAVTSAGEAITLPGAFTVRPVVVPTQFRAMIYLACDNQELEEDCFRLVDQLEEATLTAPDLRVAILWDGWSAGDSAYYLVRPDNRDGVWANYTEGVDRFALGEVDTGDKRTLVEFAGWAQSQFPGTYKMLSLVGHGGGWAPDLHPGQSKRFRRGQPGEEVGGMLWDEHPESTMSTRDLTDALAAIGSAYPIEVLYLDACLMSNIEVIAELADHSSYIVAHESWTYTFFPYKEYLEGVSSTTTPLDLARTIADMNREQWDPNVYPSQISVIDTAKVDQLLAALGALSGVLSDTLATNRQLLIEIAGAAARVDESADLLIDAQQSDDLVDLGDFVARLATSEAVDDAVRSRALTVRQAVADVVIVNHTLRGNPYGRSQTWELDRLTGLSIYLPVKDDWKRRYYNEEALPRFAGSAAWTSLVQQIYAGQEPPAVPEPCTEATCPDGSRQGGMLRQAHLPMVR
jgi:Tol biopolymer transport system component